jgi:hypothetical protein
MDAGNILSTNCNGDKILDLVLVLGARDCFIVNKYLPPRKPRPPISMRLEAARSNG